MLNKKNFATVQNKSITSVDFHVSDDFCRSFSWFQHCTTCELSQFQPEVYFTPTLLVPGDSPSGFCTFSRQASELWGQLAPPGGQLVATHSARRSVDSTLQQQQHQHYEIKQWTILNMHRLIWSLMYNWYQCRPMKNKKLKYTNRISWYIYIHYF